MFTIHQLSLHSRKLGLGIAVAAFAITSIVSPLAAHAATGQPGDTPPIENPGSLGVPPKKADLRIVARGKTQHGATTRYHFVIRNLGPDASGAFTAYKEAWLTKPGDVKLTDNGYFSMASLASGQQTMITITCNPIPGYNCTKGIALTLNNGTDPNLDNNMAVIE
jgi:hypothetical protein